MTKNELIMLQSLPLNIKVAKSKRRIEEFVDYMGGQENCYISFSGGKDSTVLLNLIRTLYPNMVAVFSDTGLEYPELKEFVKKQENVEIIKPKMTFKKCIEQYGYPMISKQVSNALYYGKKNLLEGKDTIRLRQLLGEEKESKFSKDKWGYLLTSKYNYSDKCCGFFKKEPFKEYENKTHKKPFIGTLADESIQRNATYLKYGCNVYNEGKEKSSPLGFWTNQDILEYLYMNEIEICSVYGDIIYNVNDSLFDLTGVKRTGCIFCGFGVHLEKGENRYQKLEKSHPKLHDYCMNKLGFKYVCQEIGIQYKSEV